MSRVFFKTFGCRTNLFDTQVMIDRVKEYEIVKSEDEADIIVINSCTVTNGADASLRNYINRFDHKKIYLTGCALESEGERLYEKNRIHSAFGHSSKDRIEDILKKERRFFDRGDKNYIDSSVVSDFVGKSRAFVKIQEGCDFECSYCIIPTVRGEARSKEESIILEQIDILAALGFSEVVLTGTNVGSYGRDRKSSIAKLFKKIAENRDIKRVRIGSLEPSQIDDEFIEILGEEKMAKHLHIALQHTSNKMLEIMNRKNRVESDLKIFEKIASYNFALGSDFIVGHPGESREIWEEAYRNLESFPLTHIHLFTYSKREGTKSALRDDIVCGDEAKSRLNEAKELVKVKNREFRERQKERKEELCVLVESAKNGRGEGDIFSGFCQFFNKIEIKSSKNLEKKWIKIDDYEVDNEKNFVSF